MREVLEGETGRVTALEKGVLEGGVFKSSESCSWRLHMPKPGYKVMLTVMVEATLKF